MTKNMTPWCCHLPQELLTDLWFVHPWMNCRTSIWTRTSTSELLNMRTIGLCWTFSCRSPWACCHCWMRRAGSPRPPIRPSSASSTSFYTLTHTLIAHTESQNTSRFFCMTFRGHMGVCTYRNAFENCEDIFWSNYRMWRCMCLCVCDQMCILNVKRLIHMEPEAPTCNNGTSGACYALVHGEDCMDFGCVRRVDVCDE